MTKETIVKELTLTLLNYLHFRDVDVVDAAINDGVFDDWEEVAPGQWKYYDDDAIHTTEQVLTKVENRYSDYGVPSIVTLIRQHRVDPAQSLAKLKQLSVAAKEFGISLEIPEDVLTGTRLISDDEAESQLTIRYPSSWC